MSIRYLCSQCAGLLKLHGVDAVNEVGRKHCTGCGSTDDDLITVSQRDCDKAIDSYNASTKARSK